MQETREAQNPTMENPQAQTEQSQQSQAWNKFSKDYDKKIFSLTRTPERRKQILERIKKGKILHIGSGPTPYLNQDLINQGNQVIATDFCQAMLDEARKKLVHPRLEYQLADSRQLPFDNSEFDSVVSVNSILPPERKDVQLITNQVYRVLKVGGLFVAFLPSYDNVQKAKRNLGLDIVVDEAQMRIKDTSGWQCFHTPDSIKELMESSGFLSYGLDKISLETDQEIKELKRLYGVDTSKSPIYEYLLTARK